MILKDLKIKSETLLLNCISGSKAYGLNTPNSDTDLKGVFLLPKKEFYGLNYTEQINNDTNDEVYYELKRFVDLLLKNNPNILELLSSPSDCILYKHPLINNLKPEIFLSKLCRKTFAEYAISQIKKSKGLNKKITNPMDKTRKSFLDFCFIIHGQGSITLNNWLKQNDYLQQDCGLIKVPHMKDVYSVFHSSQSKNNEFKGILSKENSNEVLLSAVPKNLQPIAVLNFNKDGYSKYCKDYRDYWEWVEKRNGNRFENTIENNKNYDTKNMMHTFRLLNMSEEIAKENIINVRRPDREFLLKIRSGDYEYDDLVKMADEKIFKVNELFIKSDLQDYPNFEICNNLLSKLREELYEKY